MHDTKYETTEPPWHIMHNVRLLYALCYLPRSSIHRVNWASIYLSYATVQSVQYVQCSKHARTKTGSLSRTLTPLTFGLLAQRGWTAVPRTSRCYLMLCGGLLHSVLDQWDRSTTECPMSNHSPECLLLPCLYSPSSSHEHDHGSVSPDALKRQTSLPARRNGTYTRAVNRTQYC
jgi:hypothetical protein